MRMWLALLALLCAVRPAVQRPLRAATTGFYVHYDDSVFLERASHTGTDKIVKHNYDSIYSKYFELMGRRPHIQRLLEIGLGCNMAYGPGHSAKLWRGYLPHADIWMAEFDALCAERIKPALNEFNISVVTGDQADLPTLWGWVDQLAGHNADVIIDDGGHSNMQIYNSFVVLFQHVLKPGGLYVIEDLDDCRLGEMVDGDRQHITIEILKDWMEALVMPLVRNWTAGHYQPRWKMPPRIKSIDCWDHACAITKCYADDQRCDRSDSVDPSLAAYGKPSL